MKKLTTVLLVFALLLSGCGCSKKPAATDPNSDPNKVTVNKTTVPSTKPSTPAPTAATEATTAPTTATTAPTETTAATEATVLYRHPLTGEVLEEAWSGQLTAVMVNNIKAAMPQHGLSQADIIYEIEEESSITRNMAIYSDVSKAGTLGSVRSTRTYFVSVARSFDAYLVHCGTSNHARGGGYDNSGAKLTAWKDIDQQNSKFGSAFYRDKDRQYAGYAWEHTLFTTGEKLDNIMDDLAQSNPTPVFGFKEGIDLGGELANEITIKFKGTKTTAFTYDTVTGLYTRYQHGGVSVDGSNKQTETVKNVIAIYTNQWGCSCGSGHQFYDTIGSGKGYAATNGKIVPIKWSRASVNDPFVYTLEDGSPLELDVGNSYIAVVGTKFPIAYK